MNAFGVEDNRVAKMGGGPFSDPNKKSQRLKKPLSVGTTYYDKPEPRYGGNHIPDPPSTRTFHYQPGRRAGENPAYEDSPVAQAQVARQKKYTEQTYRKNRKAGTRAKTRRVAAGDLSKSWTPKTGWMPITAMKPKHLKKIPGAQAKMAKPPSEQMKAVANAYRGVAQEQEAALKGKQLSGYPKGVRARAMPGFQGALSPATFVLPVFGKSPQRKAGSMAFEGGAARSIGGLDKPGRRHEAVHARKRKPRSAVVRSSLNPAKKGGEEARADFFGNSRESSGYWSARNLSPAKGRKAGLGSSPEHDKAVGEFQAGYRRVSDILDRKKASGQIRKNAFGVEDNRISKGLPLPGFKTTPKRVKPIRRPSPEERKKIAARTGTVSPESLAAYLRSPGPAPYGSLSKAIFSPQIPFERVYHGTNSKAAKKILQGGFKRSTLHGDEARDQVWVTNRRSAANEYARRGGANSKKGKPDTVDAVAIGRPSWRNALEHGEKDYPYERTAGTVATYAPERLFPFRSDRNPLVKLKRKD